MSCEDALKQLPKHAPIGLEEASFTEVHQGIQGVRLTTDLLCADGGESATRFYQLVADVLSSIAAAQQLTRAA